MFAYVTLNVKYYILSQIFYKKLGGFLIILDLSDHFRPFLILLPQCVDLNFLEDWKLPQFCHKVYKNRNLF